MAVAPSRPSLLEHVPGCHRFFFVYVPHVVVGVAVDVHERPRRGGREGLGVPGAFVVVVVVLKKMVEPAGAEAGIVRQVHRVAPRRSTSLSERGM